MKFLILGAGPAGLTFANRLLEKGETDFLVLEKEEEAGGLCRSKIIDDKPLDIGGGHFIDTKNQKVLEFLFKYMPMDEWKLFTRNSKIYLHNQFINSPIESNIWQLPIDEQIIYLKSTAAAGCNNNQKMPEKFVDWIYWKLGNKIADEYMIPYNQKMFGENLNILGTYWLDKLPNVSFDETLRSCLEHCPYGSQPAHTQFYYPKRYGSGEVWKRLAYRISDKIIYNENVREIDVEHHVVNCRFHADYIINTIPWMEFENIEGINRKIKNIIEQLKYTSVTISYYQGEINTDAHWIYYPQKELDYHRILVRKNFCANSIGYWSETNTERLHTNDSQYHYINKYAYPLNTIGKKELMQELLDYFKQREVYGLGRWGEWEHYNSDVVVSKAMILSDSILNKK